MAFEVALEEDLPQILELVDSCYRSDISRKGWTTDADLLEGTRTTFESLKKDFYAPGGKLFKYTEENGKITGCVYTSIIFEDNEKKMDVNLLCVHPDIQAKGLGRKLMAVAENYAKSEGCTKSLMQCVTVRSSLIAWYERQGYKNIGEIVPFPAEGWGTQKMPLELCSLEKHLI